MQKTENMAGGMSYRTMNGIDTSHIMKYLEGTNENSSIQIFLKNRDYYIASANKTISRLELTKKRVEYGHLNNNFNEMVCNKISNAIIWLNELKEYINKDSKSSDLLKSNQYKRWHAVKLIPSAAEGLIITTTINRKIVELDKAYSDLDKKLIRSATTHNKKAESIFKYLLNLTGRSDFKEAEMLRIEGYRECIIVDKKISKLLS
ncbi:hypothetical protein [Methanobacterium sp.]|uniref:hypothetical protein n=1 Tax=Methanobacterium sp. TaxID=2164 RepID=UPI003C72A0D5